MICFLGLPILIGHTVLLQVRVVSDKHPEKKNFRRISWTLLLNAVVIIGNYS